MAKTKSSSKSKSSKSKVEDKVKKSKSSSKSSSKKVKSSKKTSRIRTKASSDIKPFKEKLTKSALREFISTQTGVEKRDVNKVMNELEKVIIGSVMPKGVGEFVFPTLLKVVTKKKPATKERKGTNPFTGEPCTFKAKPATIVVKVRPRGKMKKAAKGEL